MTCRKIYPVFLMSAIKCEISFFYLFVMDEKLLSVTVTALFFLVEEVSAFGDLLRHTIQTTIAAAENS